MIPTLKAIIPAAVGVDIGCGMMAVQTSLKANDLPENLKDIRSNIEKAVPHGRTHNGGPGDRGAWANIPDAQAKAWQNLAPGLESIAQKKTPRCFERTETTSTIWERWAPAIILSKCVWMREITCGLCCTVVPVVSATGSVLILLNWPRKICAGGISMCRDINLAYFPEESDHFDEYVEAVEWAQAFAMTNRELMMQAIVKAIQNSKGIPPFEANLEAVNCHHNYVSRENHFGKNVLVTRKGAVRARLGDMGIIPGSMGAKSYIVRGLGNKDSFESCSHGAGRAMSRAEARRRFLVEDHIKATEGVECRKDKDVIDETPAAYKDIDAVMEAQKDLVEIAHTLRQIICIKG